MLSPLKSFVALVNLVGLSLSKDISHCGQDCACGRLLWTATATRVAAWPSWRASSAHSPSTDTTQLSPSPGWDPELGMATTPELGMATTLPRQRDYACYKAKKWLIMHNGLNTGWLLHLDPEALTFFAFFCHWSSFTFSRLSKKIVSFPALLLNI